jgi:DNA gyrase subunit A
MLFSDAGKAVRFAESEVRGMGRNAAGVRGMRLGLGQQVISLITAADETLSVLTATQNGYGKRTQIAEYTRHGRGAQGLIAIQCSERNGKLVAAELVAEDDEIVLITTGGVLIRTRVSEIREAGRSTQGVRLINLGDNEALAGLEKIVDPDDRSNGENGNGHAGGNGELPADEPNNEEPPEGGA